MNTLCLIHLATLSCIFQTALGQSISKEGNDLNVPADSTPWKARQIAKIQTPAPGGGIFEKIGDTYFLESGTLLFWAQYGKREGKDWALYSYRDGKTKFEFKAHEEFTQPDGSPKQFTYHDVDARRGYPGLNKASRHFLYLYSGKGGLGVNSHIYGFDGDRLKKIIGEGDKIVVSGNREVIVSGVRLERITNDNQAVIFFVGEQPKMKGWVLHNKRGFKPLFNVNDEVPGLDGPKIRDFYGPPVYEFLAKENNLFVFGDTLIVKLYVSGAPFSEGIFRITPNKTEILDSSSSSGLGSNFRIVNAASGNNFIIRSDDLSHYRDGKRTTILERKQTFSADKSGNLTVVKGTPIYVINSSAFLGPGKEHVLLGIKRNDNFDQSLYYFADNKLTGIANIQLQPNNIFTPYLVDFRPFNKHGAIVDNVFRDDKGLCYAVGPIILTKNLKVQKGGLYFDATTRSLIQASPLITAGEYYFDYSNIIAQAGPDRLIAWRRVLVGNVDLFELTR